MEKAVVFLLVGLVVLVSAKPYEPNRKTSDPNQQNSLYPLYGRNFWFGTDRIPDEYLNRLFGDRTKDLPPFVHLPDAEVPSDLIGNEEDRLLIDPQEEPIDEAQLDEERPEQSRPGDEIDEDIGEEREQSNKPAQKPQEENVPDKEQSPDEKGETPNANGDKLEDEKKSDSPADEIDGDIAGEQEKPEHKPKEDNPDKNQAQDGKGEKPNQGHDKKEKESHKHDKRPKPGQGSLIPKPPNKGDREGVEKPSKDLPRRDHQSPQQPRKDGPPQPPRSKPDAPVVQINVNVASPVF